ncbi:Glutamyl-tRNA synthetase [Enhygromyxa salina]|uniref:Glutamate--tRNA ligase n=1 Tax=Enhygromyxa salina TaxID=215803 RepID=A0A0C2D031_9BACT|nr:glutamate--tRNA ligase [Enhygromyxa salina]KIG16596.1 Glutamyl-tRNA synthetase [Enhygromyxa salina]
MTSDGPQIPEQTANQQDPGRMPPRVRIAPSPTGDPHVGTAYIGLFNYVFARKHGGTFILRIEDTDRVRSSLSSEQAIISALQWLGLTWDEGPDVGGPHAPYRQSERLDLYKRQAQVLLDKGAAYRCFCTKARLDELREQQRASKAAHYGYDRHCRELDPAQSQARAEAGETHVVRMKMPTVGETVVVDGLRGSIHRANAESDDQVIVKSDGFPTYHLANVVDDHDMGITHVIRGEEWISSTPKHVVLYEMFGWEPPRWYHIGLLRNPDKSKLSKRKNPVSIDYYRDLGYLPETLLNFLGTLGFSFGDDKERFSVAEMTEVFDWSKVSTGGPVFDQAKLAAFNADDIRALSIDELHARVMATVLSEDRIKAMLTVAQQRIDLLDDLIPYVSFFFGGSVDLAPVLPKFRIKKRSRADVTGILERYLEDIELDARARGFTGEGLEAFSREFCERHQWKARELFTLLRLAVTGRTASPGLFETLQICGKDRVRRRIREVIAVLRAGEDW